jgi:hypothetical protein
MNKTIKISIAILMSLLFVSVLLLSGCATKKDISVYLQEPTVTKGPTRQQLVQLLQSIGVPVLQKSDEMVIALSNSKLFQKNSTALKPGNARLLQVVALLMRKDQKTTVNVVSYTDPTYVSLAGQQTRYLAQLLWQYNIDARIIQTNSFANNKMPWECGRINQCTLIRYHYFPKTLPYN